MTLSPSPTPRLTAAHRDLLQLVFDETWYRGRYSLAVHRVAQGQSSNLLADYLTHGLANGEPPGPLIDENLLRLGERRITFLHYLALGAEQAPCPLFDERDYLRRYPEVAAAVQRGEFVSG